MGFKIEHNKSEESSLDIYIENIAKEAGKTEKEVLQQAGEALKEKVEKNLQRHKRNVKKRYKDRPAFCDDVKLTIRKGKNGNMMATVQGGKATGTLWHIVNDGTLHTRGIHFLDNALAEMDKEADRILDKVMK